MVDIFKIITYLENTVSPRSCTITTSGSGKSDQTILDQSVGINEIKSISIRKAIKSYKYNWIYYCCNCKSLGWWILEKCTNWKFFWCDAIIFLLCNIYKCYNFYTNYVFDPNFSVTIRETSILDVYLFFELWLAQVWNKFTKKFVINPVKKVAILNLNTNIRLNSIVKVPSRVFTLQDVKILGIDPINLDVTSGDPILYTVNFVCKDII